MPWLDSSTSETVRPFLRRWGRPLWWGLSLLSFGMFVCLAVGRMRSSSPPPLPTAQPAPPAPSRNYTPHRTPPRSDMSAPQLYDLVPVGVTKEHLEKLVGPPTFIPPPFPNQPAPPVNRPPIMHFSDRWYYTFTNGGHVLVLWNEGKVSLVQMRHDGEHKQKPSQLWSEFSQKDKGLLEDAPAHETIEPEKRRQESVRGKFRKIRGVEWSQEIAKLLGRPSLIEWHLEGGEYGAKWTYIYSDGSIRLWFYGANAATSRDGKTVSLRRQYGKLKSSSGTGPPPLERHKAERIADVKRRIPVGASEAQLRGRLGEPDGEPFPFGDKGEQWRYHCADGHLFVYVKAGRVSEIGSNTVPARRVSEGVSASPSGRR